MVVMFHAINEPYPELHLTSTQYFVFWWSSSIYLSLVIMGVPLFIMLSGCLLLQPSKVDEPIRVFLSKRLSRIGFAFVFWSLIYFAWSYYVNHEAITSNSVIQSFLSGGAYKQFWFIYLIMGLYLITPILRIVVAHADKKILRYLIILWFIAATLLPLFHLITGFEVDANLFTFGGFIGYFVLGIYLISVKLKTKTLKKLLAAGIISTIIGLYLMSFPFQSEGQYFFFTYITSANVVLASISAYMLLAKYPKDWPKTNHPKLSRLTQAISANTLPIFFFHVIVLETLNKGLLGFKISLLEISPLIEIPLATAVTLIITLGLILLMKKVPILKTLIG
jgi:surface polysaccharide O-acyltransferase-like enzyme